MFAAKYGRGVARSVSHLQHYTPFEQKLGKLPVNQIKKQIQTKALASFPAVVALIYDEEQFVREPQIDW